MSEREPEMTIPMTPMERAVLAMQATVTAMRSEQAVMRADICGHLHVLTADVSSLKDSGRHTADQVNTLIEWRRQNSERVKSLSESDLKDQALLAEEIVARKALAEDVATTKAEVTAIKEETGVQTQILRETANDVRKFITTPAVKVAGGVLFGILSSWLANHYGIRLPE